MSKRRMLGLNSSVNVGHNLPEASAAICEVGIVMANSPNS